MIRLKELREQSELTQTELSEKINVSRSTYGMWEQENEIIPIKQLNNLVNHYNVSIDYVLGYTNTLNYKNSIKEINSAKNGLRLKEFRKDNKLTQAKLAETLNTTQAVIANYERGRNIIATPFLYTICSKYHISADYLLGKIDTPKYLK